METGSGPLWLVQDFNWEVLEKATMGTAAVDWSWFHTMTGWHVATFRGSMERQWFINSQHTSEGKH